MAYSENFDYERLLSLDQAKLVGRSRLNSLGSYEITLNYNKVTSATKEDCLEWLEKWRLTITAPTFSFKTYEGTWNCVSISYNEDRNIIQQIFKIDSSVGDLGDVGEEPDYSAQAGDSSRVSDGMLIEKAYYWRVTSPTDVVLPTAIEGEIWAKTANDNGDGTYDVTVSKEVKVNLTATNYTRSSGYEEQTEISTNDSEQSFVLEGGTVPNPTSGQIKTIQNEPLENGKFRTVITTRENTNLDSTSYVQAGGDRGAWSEESTTDTNASSEAELPTVDDGEMVTVSNRPNQDGSYTTTTTTRTYASRRFPVVTYDVTPPYAAATGQVFSYYSDYEARANIIIIGKNRTYQELEDDSELTAAGTDLANPNAKDQYGNDVLVYQMISNISLRLNDVGRFDYTITARVPG